MGEVNEEDQKERRGERISRRGGRLTKHTERKCQKAKSAELKKKILELVTDDRKVTDKRL